MLGGEIVVPTLKESVKYSIPAGTQSGSTFRLRGQGIPRLNRDGRGDLLVTVTIDVPKRLNDKQKEALEAFRDACSDSPAPKPGKKTLFSKVKEAFND